MNNGPSYSTLPSCFLFLLFKLFTPLRLVDTCTRACTHTGSAYHSIYLHQYGYVIVFEYFSDTVLI